MPWKCIQLTNLADGPTAGGHIAPELPQKLLLQGSYAKDLKIMVGHNTLEGLYVSSYNHSPF